MPDVPNAPATRPTYTIAAVRANTLVEGDVFRDTSGDWREVLNTWTDDDRDDALAHYDNDESAEARTITDHLTGLNLYVLVRYLVETSGTPQLADQLTPFRACDLVIIQTPTPLTPQRQELASASPTGGRGYDDDAQSGPPGTTPPSQNTP